MTEVFRVRIDRKLLAQTKTVARSMGTSPAGLVKMLFAQVVNQRSLPFRPTVARADDDLLDVPSRNRLLLSLDDSEGW